MEYNRVHVSGKMVGRDEVRSSPAGVRLCDLKIEHRSRQPDGTGWKEVRFVARVRVSDPYLDMLLDLPLGEPLEIQGYLGRQSHQDAQLIIYAWAVHRLNQE